jgi:hypothetical protein
MDTTLAVGLMPKSPENPYSAKRLRLAPNGLAQQMKPPSTTSADPVVNADSSDARKR